MEQNMKKRLGAIAVLLCFAFVFACPLVSAAEESEASEERVLMYVTIADENGALALAYEEIAVSDTDDDGVLTVHDALYCAHEAKYEGGASAGYGAEESQYGLSMTKLWGAENGGSYGYCVNHASAMSLLDPVSEGDLISAYVFTDLQAWSDTYCWFDQDHVAVSGDDTLTLTLTASSYDENWNPVTVPVAGATILIDGKKTAFTTDEDGKVELSFDGTGYCVVSAEKDGMVMVPPVCAVAVSSDKLPAGDSFSYLFWFSLAAVSVTAVLLLKKHSRREAL